jgi:hypothetical protein
MPKVIRERAKEQSKQNDKRIQDQFIRKGKTISKYRRVLLSMQNQLEVGCLLDTFIFSCIMRRLLSMQIQIN